MRSPGSYAFSQAVRHVLSYLGEAGCRDPEKRLRFRVNPNLSFPPTDIDEIRCDHDESEGPRLSIMLNLMGLHGTSSPLPAYFTEYVAQHQDEQDPLRDFFDVFNHQLIVLLYKIWNKYRYYLQYREGGLDKLSSRFFSFIGLGHKDLRRTSGLRQDCLLSYMGLIAFSGESTGSLESILRHYFGHSSIHITPCISRVVQIHADQRCSLGIWMNRLANDFLLGSEVIDQTGKFRIVLEALSWERFSDFLPNGRLFSELQTLVRFVLRSRLDFDVQLKLNPFEIPLFTIGEDSPCRLGWSTWAGEGGEGIIILEPNSGYRE
jgi:type VI secretion system protein ImpH